MSCGSAPRSSEAHGDGHLEALTLRTWPTGASERVATGHAFVFIGAQPRTEWLAGILCATSEVSCWPGPTSSSTGSGRGAGRSTGTRGRWRRASPGVFVAGDVRADSVKRVASAVGEGAMAVTLAHRYLGAP